MFQHNFSSSTCRGPHTSELHRPFSFLSEVAIAELELPS
jgi:hypothetical protein